MIYKLVNGVPTPTDDITAFDIKNRIVEKTMFYTPYKVELSTVFLGVPHWNDMWFESAVVIFKGQSTEHEIVVVERYKTLEEAELGHERLVQSYLKWLGSRNLSNMDALSASSFTESTALVKSTI